MNEKYLKLLPLGLFCATIGKLLIFGATWEGAATCLVAAALAGAFEYRNYEKKLKDLEAKIELITIAANNQAKAVEELRNAVGSVRLGQQAKSLQPVSQSPTQRIF